MDKKALEKDYQQGVKLIQEYVTNYLVENYEGIEKIEWQGIGVEWRNSPIYGASLFSNYVDTDVKIYVSEKEFFTMSYKLTDYTEYDYDANKYVLSNTLTHDSIDKVSMEIENKVYKYDDMLNITGLKVTEKEKLEFEKIKKSSNGSPQTQIGYNLKLHELHY
jgi:hypothetical protein